MFFERGLKVRFSLKYVDRFFERGLKVRLN
jgi:hypothetical protein